MIVLLGLYRHILEGIADLIPEHFNIQFHLLKPDENLLEDDNSIDFQNTKLIIINMDCVHKEALNFISQLKRIIPHPKVLALDTHNSKAMAQFLLKKGASAYLPLTANIEQISAAILEQLAPENDRANSIHISLR